MELVHAPVAQLKELLTQSFEDWAGTTDATGASGASCAISGGGTALIFLPALKDAAVDWSKITLFWTDERAVAVDDPESNYGIAERMLLTPLGDKAPRAIRMPTELPLDEAAIQYDDALGEELRSGRLDLAILGVGEDGHVASIFKGAQGAQGAIGAQGAQHAHSAMRVIGVDNAPKMPRRRLSLTMAFLLQTRKIWIVAVGSRKLPVLHTALSKTQRSTPLDLLIHQAKDVTVFTDQVIRTAALHSRPYG